MRLKAIILLAALSAAGCRNSPLPSIQLGVTDAGVNCANVVHHPVLGTFNLGAGFSASEFRPLPAGVLATASAPAADGGRQLFSLNSRGEVSSLGNWPTDGGSGAVIADALDAEGRDGGFVSGFLVHHSGHLAAGYTFALPQSGFPGKLMIHQLGGGTRHVSAPGNNSVTGAAGAFLVNGLGLDGIDGGPAIYAHRLDAGLSAVLAQFDPAFNAASGLSATTRDQVAVLGYFNTSTLQNHLRGVSPAIYAGPLDAGAAFGLDGGSVLYAGADLLGVAPFGAGVALQRGEFAGSGLYTRNVTRLPIDSSGTPGALEPVLTATSPCTSVVVLGELGDDLLVGLEDRQGRRLVRVRRQ
jgi:hypothetical protein